MEKIVIVDHLTLAGYLNNISFTLQKGELVGLVGVKDAGKTTIVKLISGLLKPESGFVSIDGFDPSKRSVDFLKKISVSFKDSSRVFKNLAPIDILEILKEIYSLTNREFGKNLNDLTQYIKSPDLLELLIHNPKLLVLDEPDFDLEPIFEYNKRTESTVLVTSNKFDSLLGIARRIILIDSGVVLYDGAIDELMEKYANEKLIRVKLISPVDIKQVGEIATIRNYSFPDLEIVAPRSIAALTAAEIMQNLPIRSINLEELPIAEIVKKINHD